MKKPTTATTEVWYTWKEYETPEGENTPRLLTPWADPMIYEFPFNFIFRTEEEAIKMKTAHAPDEDWVLVKEQMETLYSMCSEDDGDEDDGEDN